MTMMPKSVAKVESASGSLQAASTLAALALRFSRVERITRHEDGIRPETDSDHTVMLGLIACSLAPSWLDRARLAELALVHDLAEADVGDTQTLTISDAAREDKEAREAAARERIFAEHGEGSWLTITLRQYEAQTEPEARFVKLMDKVVPKLTHAFNGCVAAKGLVTREGFLAANEAQLVKLTASYGQEFPETVALLEESMRHAQEAWRSEELPARLVDDTAPNDASNDAAPHTGWICVGVNQWILLREGICVATIDTVVTAGDEVWRIDLHDEGALISVLLGEDEGYDRDLDEPQPAMTWAEDQLCRIDPPSHGRLAAIVKALGYANDPLAGIGIEVPTIPMKFVPDGDVWWLLVDAFSADFRDALAFAFKPTESTTLRGCYDVESVFVVPGLPDSAAGHKAALAAIEKAAGVTP